MAEPTAWLLSAYGADSHRSWARWLTEAVDGVSWTTCELPGRHFRWRIRGNPLSWLDDLPAGVPDLLVATSMVDLATLRGLQPCLATVPAIYYFHENQFAYPTRAQQVRSVEPQMVQLYGALAAGELVFNSRFNRDSFLEGVEALLRRMPDAVPAGVTARLAAKCRVLPVPVMPAPAAPVRDPGLVVWNHRWEYDKAPEVFAEALIGLAHRGVSFRVALLGRRHHNTPPALIRLREALGERIVADGRVSRQRYRRLLGEASVVVSTAVHEFQGLSVMEAASAGARPLVPDALCYPEQYPAAYRYPPGDVGALTERLEEWLTDGPPPAVDVSAWYAERLLGPWRALVTDAAGPASGAAAERG
ncbi:tRNA-queuosine alpha-mannosyltransferase domain-containing protein [Arhodomonas sp. SL1]|uniref:tRNA-queuosine alpha-mannosyltransferase domain-containing protein n=1 Tax=Arhodomonas sp. SL1 TaxID=3425691 RepID=UPI003F8856D5